MSTESTDTPPTLRADVRTLTDRAQRIRLNHSVIQEAQAQIDADVRDLLAHLLIHYGMTVSCSAAGDVKLRATSRSSYDVANIDSILHLLGPRSIITIAHVIANTFDVQGHRDAADAAAMLEILRNTLPWDMGGNTR